jgi:hypothetical protein
MSPTHRTGKIKKQRQTSSCIHQNLSEDQCVFIRGFRVTRTLRILPKHLIAAAGPSSDPDEYDDEPDPELTAIPAITKVKWYLDGVR